MNILTLVTIASYVWVLSLLVRDFNKARRLYNVKFNGKRFVVRDRKGRFVTITSNPFNVLRLGA